METNKTDAAADYPGMYRWQQEAIQAWRDNARRGVVQAVTGAGKTRIGIGAAYEAVRQGLKVLILVPTAELQRQWMESLREALPTVRRGSLGDGRQDTLDKVDILVAIVHSAATRETLREHKAGLLIADECHRYAADNFSAALDDGYAWRLGLSATYERDDMKHLSVLDPYFDRVVFNLWYDRALAEQVIAPFKLAFISVQLTPTERTRYDALTDDMGKAARILQRTAGIPREPFSAFIAAVVRLTETTAVTPERAAARRYMSSMSARREVLAGCRTKMLAVAALNGVVRNADRSLVFTQTVEAARSAATTFSAMGLAAGVIDSSMSTEDRVAAMTAFRRGDLDVIAAPKVLDEGVDVPAADFGIVVSASRSRRQMVQRLGRVIRRKPDRRLGRMAVLYCAGTVEDPAMRQEGHLEDIAPFASAHARFDIATDLDAIEAFLAPEFEPADLVEPPNPRHIREDFEHLPSDIEPDLDGPVPQADDVELYMRSINHEILTFEEEQELAVRIEAGVAAEHRLAAGGAGRLSRELEEVARDGSQAFEQLYVRNLRLVVSYARRYQHQGLDLLDLIQEGNIGLHTAVQRFDHQLGNRFSTYATWWIRQAITRGITGGGRTIRLPVHAHDELAGMKGTVKSLAATLNREPTMVELAAAVGKPVEKVERLFRSGMPVLSLDVLVTDGTGGVEPLGVSMMDPDASVEDVALAGDLRNMIGTVLEFLPAREARIVVMRAGLDGAERMTLDEVGQVLGVTRERIRQLEKLAFSRLAVMIPPEYRLTATAAPAATLKAAA